MKIRNFFLFLFMSLLFHNVYGIELTSPNHKLQLQFSLEENGVPFYDLTKSNNQLLGKSRLGFQLKDQKNLCEGFEIIESQISSFNHTWHPIWGEVDMINNHYNELFVLLREKTNPKRLLNLRFRLYDDGLGFRYEFPNQRELTHFHIQEELTEFNVLENCKAYWIPGDYDSNEYVYNISRLSDVPKTMSIAKKDITSKTLIDDYSVQTPLLLKRNDGIYLNIHEAALVDYPAMALTLDSISFVFKANLAPDPSGNKGRIQTDFSTPWRTIIVADNAADIINSKLILNLNEPCALKTTDWIKPMKYMGVWWEMFIPNGKTWNYCDASNVKIDQFDYSHAIPNGHHGATTENVKKYIDFASLHGFDALLIEGWNIGWEDWFDKQKDNVFDFVTPYPDFDVAELTNYANQKKVSLIMHHETSGSLGNYERRMEEAYDLMNKYGYKTVKSGYVGRLLPVKEYHYGQTFVNHCLYAIKKAAEHKIMVNVHEAPRPTGLHRTYPNYMACESARGTEYEAFAFNKPNHTTILPFTRLIGGPMDYTPGIFQLDFNFYDENNHKTLSSTLAKQLGLYVVLYSPLQMAADLPTNYNRFLDAFQFIKEVPTDWKETKVLEAEPGEYVTIARKDKLSDDWYIGCTVNEKGHKSRIKLDFLEKGKRYIATIYKDGKKADYKMNPIDYIIEKRKVNRKSKLIINCASGGGYAISINEQNK